MDYERGLDALKRHARGREWYRDFAVQEAALRENLLDERRFGSSEQCRRDRARIVDQLNGLALAHLGILFNDLCLDGPPAAAPMVAKPRRRVGADRYDLAAIRDLLRAAFTADDLERFCLDRPRFRFLLDHFGPGFSFLQMIDAVLEQCRTQDLFPSLLSAIEQTNPRQYEAHGPYQR